MNPNTVRRLSDGQNDPDGPYIKLPLPAPDERLFRYGATGDLLWLLVSEPDRAFSHRELARRTDFSLNAVNHAIEALEAVGWVEVTPTGAGNEVRIAPDALEVPDDPVLRIPQREFHEPVRALAERLEEELDDVEGMVLHGSVATGDADRSSDVDLFVLVSENAPRNQRLAHEVESEFESRTFDGQRYEPHVIVNSPATVTLGDEQYEAIFREGIVLAGSGELSELRESVLSESSSEEATNGS